MKHYNKIIISALTVGVLFASCKKEDINEGIQNNEVSTTKILGGEDEFKAYFFDAAPGFVTLDVLDVRRDAKDQEDLNKTNTVIVKADQELLDQYNTDNGTSFEFFTDYEAVAGSIPFDGTNWTAAFAPGDFSKLLTIKFDPTTLDLTKQYAMAFTITDGGGLSIASTKSHLIVQIAIKNKYDGIYTVTGTMADVVNPDLVGYFPMTYYLNTVGANSNAGFDPDVWGDYFVPIMVASTGDLSGYGSFAPVFEFDPNTDKVVAVTNLYGQPAGNSRSGEIDPTGINQWNAADKSMDVKFFMKQPTAVPAPPNIRTSFSWHFEYVGPR